KLTVETISGRISAIRFFFVKVLGRSYREIDLVYPKRPERLPVILSEEEVRRLIESARTSYHRVILMTLYATGMRREELSRLKLTDVDSQRMVIHVRQGSPITRAGIATVQSVKLKRASVGSPLERKNSW